MNLHKHIFHKLGKYFRRSQKTSKIHAEIHHAEIQADYVDSQDCGLLDAVQSGWFLNDSNELYKGFSIHPTDVVLDVGCGAGGATLFCARRGAHVIFVDSDAEKIAMVNSSARQTIARKVEGYVSNSLPLPLPDNLASRIMAQEVLEHVEQPAEILRELVRVGQPGALYLLTVPHPTGEKIQKEIGPQSHFEAPNHINIFETDEFESLITDAGLVIESKSSYGFYWTMWMLLYWTTQKASKQLHIGATHDLIKAPYPALLNDWAKLWHQIIKIPEAAPMKQALDQLLPKSQVILARKPN
ncbi:class I SAM-dependent methyltransferase [Pseudomonas sp.]|uniref:class I SAM-dependent methyltransferase n=1 Tax=Pseudomonas sp. TaxID=306 RepID=UPI0019F57B12|nr:class I SAM-dependent methyltransferase [Pseudomonas sp.]MBF0677173.1 class I SAM-dependent methyltransferase [Pseudomonas sp.]